MQESEPNIQVFRIRACELFNKYLKYQKKDINLLLAKKMNRNRVHKYVDFYYFKLSETT